jgi:hypothetical protein
MIAFDYAAWLGRATTFTQKWDRAPARLPHTPVCSEEDIQSLVQNFPHPIPQCALDFYQACGMANGFYISHEPHNDFYFSGGAEWNGKQISTTLEWMREVLSWESPSNQEDNFFKTAFPIIEVGTGDHVVLDTRDENPNPSVGYFLHDKESLGEMFVTYIYPSFTQFLQDWECCCYMDLMRFFNQSYCDQNGIMRSDMPDAVELGAYFGEEKR